MKIFISWSGSLSKAVALDLKEWLPKVIQVAEPWVSEVDIPKGTPWFDEVRDALKAAAVGILVVTPESAKSAWLNYEAGSIAQILTNRRVCPFVVGMTTAQVEPPLGLLNGTEANNGADVLNFLLSVAPKDVKAEAIEHAFTREWPDFQVLLERRVDESRREGAPPATRTMEDKIDEVLGFVRHKTGLSISSTWRVDAAKIDGQPVIRFTNERFSNAPGAHQLFLRVDESNDEPETPEEKAERLFEEDRDRQLERHLEGDHRFGEGPIEVPD